MLRLRYSIILTFLSLAVSFRSAKKYNPIFLLHESNIGNNIDNIELKHLSNSELVKKMNQIKILDESLVKKLQNSNIDGFILESIDDQFLLDLQFNSFEIKTILMLKKTLFQKEKSRHIFFTDTMGTVSFNFTMQSAYDNFLKMYNIKALKKIKDPIGAVVEYLYLENNEYYCGISRNNEGMDIDPVTEIKYILNAIRTKADLAAVHFLSKKYNHEVKFVQHDMLLYKPEKPSERVGDIDSLFTSPDTDYLMERKRTVNEDVINQILKTREVYKELLKSQGSEKNVVSILYAETIDGNIAEKLYHEEVHVMRDPTEIRFFDEHDWKIFESIKKIISH